jgi:hypothetical protein
MDPNRKRGTDAGARVAWHGDLHAERGKDESIGPSTKGERFVDSMPAFCCRLSAEGWRQGVSELPPTQVGASFPQCEAAGSCCMTSFRARGMFLFPYKPEILNLTWSLRKKLSCWNGNRICGV